MNRTGAVDVAVSRVRTTSCVTIDPLEPVLSSMASNQILKIVSGGDALRFCGPQEVVLDGVSVVAKGNLDWAFESVKVTVVAGTLVRLVFLHERNELFGGPALGLEIVIIRSRCTCVHHEVDRGSTTQDVRARHDSSASIEPFGRS